MKKIILLIFIGLVSTFCFAQNKNTLESSFYLANDFYKKAQYSQAIGKYEEIISQGYASANLYYNLGNCYFKSDQLSRAILNFAKAKRLSPRDNDLEANFNYAKDQVQFKVNQTDFNTFKSRYESIFDKFSLDELTIHLAVILSLVVLLICLRVILKSYPRSLIIGISIFSIIFVLGVSGFINKAKTIGKEAIVLDKEVAVTFEPRDGSTTHFNIYEGMKVFLLKSKQDWCKIERSDKKIGWIKKETIIIF